MSLIRHRWLALSVIPLLVLLLAACSASTGQVAGSGTKPAATNTPATDGAAAAPPPGGQPRVAPAGQPTAAGQPAGQTGVAGQSATGTTPNNPPPTPSNPTTPAPNQPGQPTPDPEPEQGGEGEPLVHERLAQGYSVGGSPHVVVETFNGTVEVKPGAANRVEAAVIKGARTQANLAKIEAGIKQEGDTIRVFARPLSDRIWPLEAPVTLTVPSGAVLELKTSNGNVQVEADQAAVKAETSNGTIRFLGGLVAGEQSFQTSNGNVELLLPANAGFRVEAQTSNGQVVTDFPVSRSGRANPTSLLGQVGDNPTTVLRLQTSNGSIQILQRK